VQHALKDLARGGGDRSQQLSVHTPDEAGHVARWFNTFAGKIRSSAASTAEQTSAAAEQAGKSVQSAASATEESNRLALNAAIEAARAHAAAPAGPAR
jgi:methyl-accepting chemotaxis protein